METTNFVKSFGVTAEEFPDEGVKFSIEGLERKDVKVNVQDDILTIHASKGSSEVTERYHLKGFGVRWEVSEGTLSVSPIDD